MLPIPDGKLDVDLDKDVLSGPDGNAFSILARVDQAMQDAGYSKELRDQYFQEATSSTYMNLIEVSRKYTGQ